MLLNKKKILHGYHPKPFLELGVKTRLTYERFRARTEI
jgi:hypothetical protein